MPCSPNALQARLVWQAVVDVGEREPWGLGPRGERWGVPILGGHFWGASGFEGLHGLVCAGGADRQTLRPDGIKELDALYEMRTHDGALLTVHNQVLIDESVQPERYARSCIRVSAPQGPAQGRLDAGQKQGEGAGKRKGRTLRFALSTPVAFTRAPG